MAEGGVSFKLFVAVAACDDFPCMPAITANTIAANTQTTSSRRTKLSRLSLSIWFDALDSLRGVRVASQTRNHSSPPSPLTSL